MQRTPGYYVEVNGDSVSLSFEPWFTESDRRFSTPCMRILLRRAGERIVLEQFVIDDGEDSRTLDIESAHDALQAWMDYLSD